VQPVKIGRVEGINISFGAQEIRRSTIFRKCNRGTSPAGDHAVVVDFGDTFSALKLTDSGAELTTLGRLDQPGGR